MSDLSKEAERVTKEKAAADYFQAQAAFVSTENARLREALEEIASLEDVRADETCGVAKRALSRQNSAVAPRIDGESRKGPSEGVQSTTQGAPASPSSSTTQQDSLVGSPSYQGEPTNAETLLTTRQACIGLDKVHVNGNCPAHPTTGYQKPPVQEPHVCGPDANCDSECVTFECAVCGKSNPLCRVGPCVSAQAFERKPGDPDCPHGVVPRFCGRCSTVQDYPGEPSYCECADVGHGHKFGSAGCVNSVQKCICGGTGNCNGCNPEATAQDGDN